MDFSGMTTIYRLARLLLMACTMLVSGSVWADCTGGPATIMLTLPASVAVPRDAAVGTLLTSWVSSPATTNYFNCAVPANLPSGVRNQNGSFTSSSGLTMSDGNGTYTVWNTNVPGVGIAVGTRFYVSSFGNCTGGGITGWSSWSIPPVSWTGQVCTNSTYAYNADLGSQAVIALVKTGTVSVGGTISGVVAQSLPVYGSVTSNLMGQIVSFQMTPVTIVPMTCTTPDVNVPMGDFVPADFPTVGSLSPRPAAFNVQLLNCPAGVAVSGTQAGIIHSVAYRIDPSNGTISTNVAKLSGATPAGGIGIQLFTSAGTVFPLSSQQTLSTFNGSSGGDYQIPFTARYIRTGTVTPGPANGTMTLTVSYQ
jgi:major type 1 subunit fimbrin (pilin)